MGWICGRCRERPDVVRRPLWHIVVAERARADAEAKRANDLQSRLDRAEVERRGAMDRLASILERITTSPAPDEAPAPRAGIIARILGWA